MSRQPSISPKATETARSTADPESTDEVFGRVYGELRALAAHYLAAERNNHTLQPTALVHEVYMRLADLQPGQWESKRAFVSVASRAMRRVLVDHARAKRASKRRSVTVQLDPEALAEVPAAIEVTRLAEALDDLEAIDPQRASLVELRFFGGLTAKEIAGLLEIGERTVHRRLRSAEAWLKVHLDPSSR